MLHYLVLDQKHYSILLLQGGCSFKSLLRGNFNGSDHANLPLAISQYFHQILSQRPFRSRPKRRLLSSGILRCSSAGHASFQLTPGKKKGGALLREPPRQGVSESSDTIERVLQLSQVTIINYFYFSTCCYFPAFLVTRSIFFPIILRM